MKIHNVQQRSEEWLLLRLGIPTASEFDRLVSPTWKVRSGDGVETYLATKLAEKWLGHPLQTFHGGAMEQGAILEDEAVPWYEFANDVKVDRVGFITDEGQRYGCSPDGMVDGIGLEVKCPQTNTHIGYLLAGELPTEYRAQVQGSMYVTGLSEWRFLSYCRGLPPLVLTIKRDEEAIKAIAESLYNFCKRFDAGWTRLIAMNGGEPVRESAASTVEEPIVFTAR